MKRSELINLIREVKRELYISQLKEGYIQTESCGKKHKIIKETSDNIDVFKTIKDIKGRLNKEGCKKKKVNEGESTSKAFYNEKIGDIIKVINKYDLNSQRGEPNSIYTQKNYDKITDILNMFITRVIRELSDNPNEPVSDLIKNTAWEYLVNQVKTGQTPSFSEFIYAINK